jgi:hypothetical protein
LTVTVGAATGVAGSSVRTLLNEAAERAMAAKVSNRRNQVTLGRVDKLPELSAPQATTSLDAAYRNTA